MKIYTRALEGATVIQNTFIDQFMPHANGEFVKVYLYLLRCADTDRELSLSSIADVFEHTEKDVRRALAYWEKQRLLRLKLAPDGAVISATFLDPSAVSAGEAAGRPDSRSPETESQTGANDPARSPRHLASHPVFDPDPAGRAVQTGLGPDPAGRAAKSCPPASQSEPEPLPCRDASRAGADGLTRERIAELSDQADIRQLFFVAEQYLRRPLTSAQQRELVYYYDTLHFSADLIEYLLEYCISKGGGFKYMRTVALSWADAGISTVRQAKEETSPYQKNHFTVLKAFGIRNRYPVPLEQEIMSRWFDEWGLSIELVLEACRRTIQKIHEPSFEYADQILNSWHEAHITTLSGVKEQDRKHQEAKKKAAREKADREKSQPAKTPGNRFNNFSQREYDYSKLEKQLLNQ